MRQAESCSGGLVVKIRVQASETRQSSSDRNLTPLVVVESFSVEDVKCTALENDWDSPPNPLMHPPCLCPKCKVEPLDIEVESSRLRASGMRQRPLVEALELGSEGQNVL